MFALQLLRLSFGLLQPEEYATFELCTPRHWLYYLPWVQPCYTGEIQYGVDMEEVYTAHNEVFPRI